MIYNLLGEGSTIPKLSWREVPQANSAFYSGKVLYSIVIQVELVINDQNWFLKSVVDLLKYTSDTTKEPFG